MELVNHLAADASPPGSAATINDVARLAGVSKKTVSRILNDAPNVRDVMRDRVRRAMRELDYTPNQAARALSLCRVRVSEGAS